MSDSKKPGARAPRQIRELATKLQSMPSGKQRADTTSIIRSKSFPVLTKGFAWADEYVNRVIAVMKRFDFKGKRVLDIGCRDGAQSFAAEQLGASEVVGIDNDLSNGLTDFLIPFKRSKVKAYQRNLNDLSREQSGEFDLVVFAGVLYHLR